MNNKHYLQLGLMTVLHFMAMYILMYSMVNTFSNVYLNLNNAYMAGLMTMPMVLIEISLMRSMYSKMKYNLLIALISVVVLTALFVFIRQQTAINDKEFIRSMIPHHSGAILMCEEASLQDSELRELCKDIISSQQSEIDQMEEILERIE